METQTQPDNARPSPREAEAALRESESIASRYRSQPVPVPPWFYPILGLCLAGLALAQLLPSVPSIILMIVLTAGIGAAIGAVSSTARYTPRINTPLVAITMLIALSITIASMILAWAYDQQWVWYPLAACALVFALILGMLHRSATSKAHP